MGKPNGTNGTNGLSRILVSGEGPATEAELRALVDSQPDKCKPYDDAKLPEGERVRHIKWAKEAKELRRVTKYAGDRGMKNVKVLRPVERWMEYVMALASSLNDALDTMQKERNNFAIAAWRLDLRLKDSIEQRNNVERVFQRQMTDLNAAANARAAEIQNLRGQLRARDAQIVALQEQAGGD